MKINYLLVLCVFITTFFGLIKSQYVLIKFHNSATSIICDDSYDSMDSSLSSSNVSPCQEIETGGTIANIDKCFPFSSSGNGTIFSRGDNNEIYQKSFSNWNCSGEPTKTIVIGNNDECYTYCESYSEQVSYTASLVSSIEIPGSIVSSFYSGDCEIDNWKDNFSYINYATTDNCSYDMEIKYYTIGCNTTAQIISAYQEPQCQNEYYSTSHDLQTSCSPFDGLNYFQFCNQ